MATSVPLQWQKEIPTRMAADNWLGDQIASRLNPTDANDMTYESRASEDYDPSAHLAELTARLLDITSADDVVNPRGRERMGSLIGNVKHGRHVLVPISDEMWGHCTHSLSVVFGPYLSDFLRQL